MKERLPGYKGNYPVWSYADYKPDLRKHHFNYPKTAFVRLGFAADASSVLISHLGLWEFVLAGRFCASSEEEDQSFGGDGPEYLYNIWQHGDQDPVSATAIRDCWHRVFDMAVAATHPQWCGPTNYLQATTGKVSLEQIFDISPFVNR